MHIEYASKAAWKCGIGYPTKGAGLGIHAVGTGFVKVGEALQGAGDTLIEFGKKNIKTGKALWVVAQKDADMGKLTDEEILATGEITEENLPAARAHYAHMVAEEEKKAQAQANTAPAAETPAETKKEESAGETIEVSPAEAAAMMC